MFWSAISSVLRWFLFVVGVAALISAGVYIGMIAADGWAGWRFVRILVFLLLGLLSILMYGESSRRSNRTD